MQNVYILILYYKQMARRKTKNRTGIKRLQDVTANDAWASFVCIRCGQLNFVRVGSKLLDPNEVYETALWKCQKCNFIHSKSSDLPEKNISGKKLPFGSWGKKVTSHTSIAAQRFWKAFFTIASENSHSYWKQCNTCGRIMPESAFSGHQGWGPLEKQMECRSCKAVINANLNPKRTKEQLHESSVRRRIGDLLFPGEEKNINLQDLFNRFESKCFKTGKVLDIKDRKSWAIDHILPSKFFYPLTVSNAALLSREANENKRDNWPSKFYSNNQLKQLAIITGANLSLISSKKPIVNPDIDVDTAVSRLLSVRGATDLSRRIEEIKQVLKTQGLTDRLSEQNKKMLGV